MDNKTEKWDSPITENTEWSGDASTGNLPVSGRRIQEFIKGQFKRVNESLAKKGGVYHLDEDGKRYLVFADEESREEWIKDKERADLILGVIQAGGDGADFSMRVTLTSEYYMSVLPSQTGLYIEFDFAVMNKDNMPTGEDALVTFTFRWNNIVKTINQKYTGGSHVRFPIDDYIGETGITNISVRVTGIDTGVSTSFAVVCNRVDLSLTDRYDIGTVYNLISNPDAYVAIPFDIKGSGIKVVEWYLDGERVAYNKSEDEITEVATSRTKYIPLNGLTEGVHNLQLRAYVTVNGQKFYSQTLYREVIVFKGEDPMKVLTAVGVNLSPNTLITESLVLNTLQQFIPYSFTVGAYDPQGGASIGVNILFNSSAIGQLNLTNGKAQTFTFTPTSSGPGKLKLVVEGAEREINTDISESSQQITEITSALSLALRAMGKSNTSIDKDVWIYNNITTEFEGFNWSEQSGWYNNRLVISGGARITIFDTPLSGNITSTGKTMEFEFATSDVKDDDAIICDLRNGNCGLLITASEASLTSSAGAKVSVKYKSGENIRVAFVINRATGVVDKQLVMIYVNGKLSGAKNYGVNDNFLVRDNLVLKSGNDVTLQLKELRFYDAALTSEQILNNYILYRDTAAEMLTVYDRNDIYTEGTSDFNIDALARQLPVMVITGDIPAIEATTNKNLQIEVDIEYTNQQNPELSFRIERGALRPQGTSSMSYPVKNLRPYTTKLGYTKLYDADGNEVENRLYAFRIGSQPVDCWCLKADYAESSGVHNTGIARLWNTVMYNAQINGQYLLRTEAQKAALQNNYPYDVRTAIDGFPILCFYRLTASSPLVFIGKYNFNNDKSTESVFGFKDIPGFNNAKMQCWEVLNNGHHLALFTDTTNWDSEWSDAFEGRYPDSSTNTNDLKAFATWMSSVTPANFAKQKWEHLDVYKVAAYYMYVMLFGAVDQMVKNAMFTSEDGVHWYFINYDNDTVLGVRNDGLLIYPPTIDRQTLDSTVEGVYAYAGHDSRLWNLCEGDTEFMQIVSTVYDALYTAGLNYNNVIKVLDEEQCDKWCERIYNQDALYKYVGPFRESGTNNLFMCQGDRKSHRRWWLSRRFNLMDSKFVAGAYKNSVFEVKLAGAPIGLHFFITSGFQMNYGYGVNNVPIQSGILLDRGKEHTFTTNSVLNVGDPLRIYAAPNIAEIDIHEFTPYLTQISIAGVFSEELGTKLEKLTLGADGVTNSSLAELSGISTASALRHLDVRGYLTLQSLDLSGNKRLETLDARYSGLASLTIANGAPITKLQLPVTMQIIDLEQLPLLDNNGLTVSGNLAGIHTLRIIDCPKIDTLSLVKEWLENINTPMANCSLELTGIDWKNIDTDWLIRFGNFNSVSLQGVIEITSIDENKADTLTNIFGLNCFESSASLYIKIPTSSTSFIIGAADIDEMSSAQYRAILINKSSNESIEWSMLPNIEGITLSQNGVLTVEEYPGSDNPTLFARSKTNDLQQIQAVKAIFIKRLSYPNDQNCYISGKFFLTNKLETVYTLDTENVTGRFTVEWSLIQEEKYLEIIRTNQDNHTVHVQGIKLPEEGDIVQLIAKVKSPRGDILATKAYDITVLEANPIMTIETNPVMMKIMYRLGVAKNPNYLLQSEAEACTSLQKDLSWEYIGESSADHSNTATITKVSFNEFVYFTNLKPSGYKLSNIIYDSITLPWEIIDEPFPLKSNPSIYYSIWALKIYAPRLREINLTKNSSYFFSTDSSTADICIDFPVLKKVFISGNSYSSFASPRTGVNLPSLEEVKTTNYAFLDFSYLSKSIKVVFDNLREASSLARLSASRDMEFYFPKAEKGIIFSSSSTIKGNITVKYGENFNADNVGLSHISEIHIPANNRIPFTMTGYGSLPKKIFVPEGVLRCTADNVFFTGLEEVECFRLVVDKGVPQFSKISNILSKASHLHTLKMHSLDAPNVPSGNTVDISGWTTGSDVPEDQPKILYLKEGATGFDEGIWIAPPLSDYIKSYTL
ncbi:MAG: hypothetical protein HDS10_01195 [Bacteroides sp.]|nr:hypothetical protein [Bacteroides sp.]